VVLPSSRQGALPRAAVRRGGERENEPALVRELRLPDALGGREPVRLRQMQVHEDDIESATGRPADGGLTALRDLRLETVALQEQLN